MPYQNVVFRPLTISSGTTQSSQLSAETTGALKTALQACRDLVLYAPLAFTGVVTVQVSRTESPTTANDWYNLIINGVAVTIAGGSATVIPYTGFRALRCVSTLSENADRVINVTGQVLL